MSVADSRDALWAHHHGDWRHPAQITGAWWDGGRVDRTLLAARARGPWWDLLAGLGVSLVVSREYEHLLLTLGGAASVGQTYFPLPHPSGIALAPDRRSLFVASTRNPNQILQFAPQPKAEALPTALAPSRTWFYPGHLYLHDLAFVAGVLHGNAVGQNAVVRFDAEGSYERCWWPLSIESLGEDSRFARNHLQLNSIAAGPDLVRSCFSASAAVPGTRRPGHRNFAVDGCGVVFDGATRVPLVRGLTRPHSARFHRGALWVDNSGYGELVRVGDGSSEVIARLPGWTRGLAFVEGIAFVGTSRVLPRFRQYAPGLDLARSRCGLHAVEIATGRILASIEWPGGNQIFAIEIAPADWRFPFQGARAVITEAQRRFFYTLAALERRV